MKRIFAAALFLAALAARAADGVSLDLGKGDRGVSLVRVGLHWTYELAKFAPHDVHPYIELSVARWHTEKGPIYDTAITPVFRYARSLRSGPYAEGAIGLHILSGGHLQENVTLSTRFQFGDHIGVGVRHGHYDVGLRLQHLSNAGLRNPNPGVNFLQLHLAYELE
ncbi:MAG: acyloxyacyl hydrolase [Burkholderiales bacterium]